MGISFHPVEGETWHGANGVPLVRVVSVSASHVSVVSVRGGKVRKLSRASFARDFNPSLANQDFLETLPVRRKALVEDFARVYRGKSVLELGAHLGMLSEGIVQHARRFTALENNAKCVALLRPRLRGIPGAKVVEGDVHRRLWSLPKRQHDIIFCAGLLYHSAHPFLVLEAMAFLEPKLILLDTATAPASGGVTPVRTHANHLNARYNQFPDAGFSLLLGERVLRQAMEALGYRFCLKIPKRALRPPAGGNGLYFRRWKRGLSAWFARDEKDLPRLR